jgi:hypothetical protein
MCQQAVTDAEPRGAGLAIDEDAGYSAGDDACSFAVDLSSVLAALETGAWKSKKGGP